MAIDWEAELDGLGNDDRESWAAEKNYTEGSSGIPEAMGPVPPLILYNTAFVRWHFTQIRYEGII